MVSTPVITFVFIDGTLEVPKTFFEKCPRLEDTMLQRLISETWNTTDRIELYDYDRERFRRFILYWIRKGFIVVPRDKADCILLAEDLEYFGAGKWSKMATVLRCGMIIKGVGIHRIRLFRNRSEKYGEPVVKRPGFPWKRGVCFPSDADEPEFEGDTSIDSGDRSEIEAYVQRTGYKCYRVASEEDEIRIRNREECESVYKYVEAIEYFPIAKSLGPFLRESDLD